MALKPSSMLLLLWLFALVSLGMLCMLRRAYEEPTARRTKLCALPSAAQIVADNDLLCAQARRRQDFFGPEFPHRQNEKRD